MTERRTRRLSDREIAHDLRGASHTALGFAALLAARCEAPEARRAASALTAAVRRLVTITDAVALLDREPVAAGRAELASVDDAVRRAVDEQRDAFAARGTDVVLEQRSSTERMTTIDLQVLDQLLSLVLTWAVYRTPPRSDVVVTIDGADAESVVTVALGARAQLDVCVALATELAVSSGAQVRVEPDDGSVTLVLPAPIAPDRQERDAFDAAPAAHLRILHVDDDPTSRALVEMVFGAADGCSVVAVTSIAEARAALERAPVDVVLVDQHHGGELGRDQLRAVRS